jgi:hypothetical protein
MRRFFIETQLGPLLTCLWLLSQGTIYAQFAELDETTTELEDFMVYADPEVMDALRNRPFSKRDPTVEAFFQALPAITNEVYSENLREMRSYLQNCKLDKDRKIRRIAELAGLSEPPEGLIDGYEERIETLETLLKWMTKEMPIQLKRLDIWKEPELRWRLKRGPVPNIRLHPETDELESRLFFNWKMIFQYRPRARNLKLDFDMGIHLREQTGFYNPDGFLQWSELHRKDLKTFEISYPVILTETLKDNLSEEMPQYLAAYKATMDSFYHILREFFFSDLADIHALYILTRGRILSDEWHQYQATALGRGLAAYLVFQSLEGKFGRNEILELQKNDWTTWHTRKIGSEYNSITWEGEKKPYAYYGDYKRTPDLRNIYWSTLFVQSLADKYGASFVSDMCNSISQNSREGKKTDNVLFQEITGDELEKVTLDFLAHHSAL